MTKNQIIPALGKREYCFLINLLLSIIVTFPSIVFAGKWVRLREKKCLLFDDEFRIKSWPPPGVNGNVVTDFNWAKFSPLVHLNDGSLQLYYTALA